MRRMFIQALLVILMITETLQAKTFCENFPCAPGCGKTFCECFGGAPWCSNGGHGARNAATAFVSTRGGGLQVEHWFTPSVSVGLCATRESYESQATFTTIDSETRREISVTQVIKDDATPVDVMARYHFGSPTVLLHVGGGVRHASGYDVLASSGAVGAFPLDVERDSRVTGQMNVGVALYVRPKIAVTADVFRSIGVASRPYDRINRANVGILVRF